MKFKMRTRKKMTMSSTTLQRMFKKMMVITLEICVRGPISQRFQRRRLNDGGEWREYRQSTCHSGRRVYEDGDRSHDRNKQYKRWTHDEIVKKRQDDDAFAEKSGQ
eukprot:2115925-Amphidinium_carterae.1